MRETTLTASVNYGDFGGTVAADRHDHQNLLALAKRHGVDTNRFFVFGLNINVGENRDDSSGSASVAVLAVDTQATGTSSDFDAIQRYVDRNPEAVQYVRFDTEATLEEALLAFKRIDLVFLNESVKGATRFQRTFE